MNKSNIIRESINKSISPTSLKNSNIISKSNSNFESDLFKQNNSKP